jgi:hypothetical protein
MKTFVAALVFGLALGAGVASADTIENGYGNTFVVTAPDGSVARYYFDADGSFHATAPDSSAVTGTYTVAAGQLCFTMAGASQAQCTQSVSGKNVGDTWTQMDAAGNSISITLQAGRP